jgi:alpha-L-rhamnosidase
MLPAGRPETRSGSPWWPVAWPLLLPLSGWWMMLSALEFRTAAAQPADIVVPAPENLRVEGLLEPVAIISEWSPRFSFLHGDIVAAGFGVTQASYRITVADTDSGTPLWDSGDVKSSNCSQIAYAGKPLPPFTRFAWSVEWTSSAGVRSAPASAHFETGPMQPSDWQGAGWLSDENSQMRNEFEVAAHKKIAYARVYVAAAGCAHIEVNGRVPLPDHRGICPWPVDFDTVRYITHDITDLVEPGKNAVGVVLGNVMDGPRAVILVIIKHEGDPNPTFALSSSSSGWMATAPYVTTSTAWDASIDWTKQEPGWSAVGFTLGPRWNATKVVPARRDVPARALAMPLSTVLGEVKPVSVDKVSDGSFLYSFPKTFVGTVQFKPLPAAATGSNLTVLLGEWLVPTDPGGPVPPDTGGEPKPPLSSTKNTYPKISVGHNGYNGFRGQQYENHVLRAGNADRIGTLFCWHAGFQYVRVT